MIKCASRGQNGADTVNEPEGGQPADCVTGQAKQGQARKSQGPTEDVGDRRRSQNEHHLPRLNAQIESQQRNRDLLGRQACFSQCRCEAEAVEQSEGERNPRRRNAGTSGTAKVTSWELTTK